MNMFSKTSPRPTRRGVTSQATLSLLALGLLSVSAASAQTINEREAVLQDRISTAARTGQISRQERARLQDRLNEIRVMEKRAKADGMVTKAEYQRINAAMDGLSQSIRRQRID